MLKTTDCLLEIQCRTDVIQNKMKYISFQVSSTHIQTQQKEIQREAKIYFASLSPKKSRIDKERLSLLANQEHLLTYLLENNNILSIGELHHHQSSKKFLIDNMPTLKANGVEIIYLEHVFYDTQKELFEAYFSSDTLRLPVILQDYLYFLDERFKLSDGKMFTPYSFTGLVVQAKRYGIRVIPIDTRASYETGSALSIGVGQDPGFRCLMMNYVAAMRHLEQDTRQKAIFFVGSAHLNAVNSGVPGIQEITGAATLVIEDENQAKTQLTAENHIAKPDVLLYLKPELSAEAQQLITEYTVSKQISDARRAVLMVTPFVPEERVASQASDVSDSSEDLTNPSELLSSHNIFSTFPNKTVMIGGSITIGLVIGTIISHFLLSTNIAIVFLGFAILAALATFLLNSSLNKNQPGMS
jgi:hypothetical protein